jgi:DNA-directed RNA polymerase specialized sigma24 family protein
MVVETDLERDLSNGPLAESVLDKALKQLSPDSREIIRLRYSNGTRTRLTADFVEEFGWSVREANGRVRAALAELGECVREIVEGGSGE